MERTPIASKPNLPAELMPKLQEWQDSPRKCYDRLPDIISHTEIFRRDSPTLGQISRILGLSQAVMIVSMAISDINLLFRKDRRMEEADIVAVGKMIVRQFWYLKPEDIKKCFQGRRPKSFVLEGDSFLSWLSEYDLERDKACEADAINGQDRDSSPDAISHTAYLMMLQEQARNNGKESERARQVLDDMENRKKILSPEEMRQKEIDFRLFRHRYLKEKGIINDNNK